LNIGLSKGHSMLQSVSRATLLGVLIMSAMLIVAPAFCQKPQSKPTVSKPAASDARAFAFVVAGMKEARRKLVSGVCRFEGTLDRERRETPDDCLHGSMRGLIAIDGDKVRYDIVRPDWVMDKSTIEFSKTQPGKVTVRTMKGVSTRRFADDGTRTTTWHSDDSIVEIAQSKDFANRRGTEYVDVRGITLFDQNSIDHAYTLEQVFDHLSMFRDKYQGKVTGVDSATWVLSWSHQDDTPWITKWTLTVDVESGFTPRTYKYEELFTKNVDDLLSSLGSKPISPRESETLKLLRGNEGKWLPAWENRTDWAQINGVWVPTHHESEIFRGLFSSVAQKKTYDFRWEGVNQPVNQNLFNSTTFEIPENVGIQDSSGGGAVWIKEIPGSHVEAEAAIESPARWKLIIGATLTVAAFLIAWLLLLKKKIRRRS
jgi:hypothetical protein